MADNLSHFAPGDPVGVIIGGSLVSGTLLREQRSFLRRGALVSYYELVGDEHGCFPKRFTRARWFPASKIVPEVDDA